MNDEQRKRVIELMEAQARMLGALRGWISTGEATLNALRDELYASDVLQNGNGAPPQAAPQVTTYSQRDPRWASNRIGTSNTSIGSYGCLITAVASMLTDAGHATTPAELNTLLSNNRGYTGGNRFVFTSVDGLGGVKFRNIVECNNIPAPVAQFDELVSGGDFVIVKVDFDPDTVATEEHWVRYLGDGQMFDPWHGDIAPIVPRYRGHNAAEAILRAVVYKRIAK